MATMSGRAAALQIHFLTNPIRTPSYVLKSRKQFKVNVVGLGCVASASSATSFLCKAGVRFVEWYVRMLQANPVVTKSITSGIVYSASDFTAQIISRKVGEGYDLVRTSRMAGYGLLILGPILHCWFNFVSRLLPGLDLISVLKKMFLGQALFGPTMTVVFFSLIARMQGENNAEIVARLKRDMIPTMLNGGFYWPICDFITFRFTPVHLQPLASNIFSYVWTIYMTYMATREKAIPTAS